MQSICANGMYVHQIHYQEPPKVGEVAAAKGDVQELKRLLAAHGPKLLATTDSFVPGEFDGAKLCATAAVAGQLDVRQSIK